MARATRRKTKSKGITYKGKRIYGAAAKNVTKKRAAAKRKRTAASKKRTAAPARKRRNPAPARKRRVAKAGARKRRNPMPTKRGIAKLKKRSSAAVRSSRAKASARKAAKTRALKKAARSRSAKKAAATRKRNLRKTTTRRTAVAKKRRRPARKTSAASRRRAAARRRTSSRRRLRTPIRARRKLRRRKSGVSRGLKVARRRVRSAKRRRRPVNVAYMRRYGIRANPKYAIVDALKRALPVAAALYGTRALSKKVLPRIPGIDRLGRHAAPVASIGLLWLAAMATKKGKLAKHRLPILMGVALNAIDVTLGAYIPASVQAQIGMGATPLYDGAMGEYVGIGATPLYDGAMGEYVEMGMGDYIEMGGLEQEMGMGAVEELGLEEELGMGAANLQIGTGIGTPYPSMSRPVPQRAFSAPVPQRSFIKQVPQIGPGFDDAASFNTGIFAGGIFAPKTC